MQQHVDTPAKGAAEDDKGAQDSRVASYRQSRRQRRRALRRGAAVGLGAGLVCVALRWLLETGEAARTGLLEQLHRAGSGWLWVPVAMAAAGGGVAVWLVRSFAPEASGSGIPQIKNVLADLRPMRALRIVLVKFIGSSLAIASGFALGREGPSVQLGGAVGDLMARMFGGHEFERKTLIIAGASAGLSAAFNAPFAGVVFAVEELRGELSAPVFVAACAASVVATALTRVVMGSSAVYAVGAMSAPQVSMLPVFAMVGIVAGLAGVMFNRALLGGLRIADRTRGWRPGMTGVLAGVLVGLVAWWWPTVVGGGQQLANDLLHATPEWWVMVAVFAVRFLLTIVCYSSGAPGGIFAPMLVLGLLVGQLTGMGLAAIPCIPGAQERMCGLCGMGAYFTAVTRAPLTGIVLIVEMSGYYGIMPALLTAVLTAYMVAELLRDEPIYVALARRG